jgi:hypothetical protein
MRPVLTLLLLLALATPALAVDGVLGINQACAVNTGCFAGDTPGFPVTISASGSYRLTSKLNVPDENTGGISVNANDVGIDSVRTEANIGASLTRSCHDPSTLYPVGRRARDCWPPGCWLCGR